MPRTSEGFLTISSRVRLRGSIRHSQPRRMLLVISSSACDHTVTLDMTTEENSTTLSHCLTVIFQANLFTRLPVID